MTTLPPDDPALSEVVNECLEALRRGESIDDCLNRHPDIADGAASSAGSRRRNVWRCSNA